MDGEHEAILIVIEFICKQWVTEHLIILIRKSVYGKIYWNKNIIMSRWSSDLCKAVSMWVAKRLWGFSCKMTVLYMNHSTVFFKLYSVYQLI